VAAPVPLSLAALVPVVVSDPPPLSLVPLLVVVVPADVVPLSPVVEGSDPVDPPEPSVPLLGSASMLITAQW
jgi:hypothetical protein